MGSLWRACLGRFAFHALIEIYLIYLFALLLTVCASPCVWLSAHLRLPFPPLSFLRGCEGVDSRGTSLFWDYFLRLHRNSSSRLILHHISAYLLSYFLSSVGMLAGSTACMRRMSPELRCEWSVHRHWFSRRIAWNIASLRRSLPRNRGNETINERNLSLSPGTSTPRSLPRLKCAASS